MTIAGKTFSTEQLVFGLLLGATAITATVFTIQQIKKHQKNKKK